MHDMERGVNTFDRWNPQDTLPRPYVSPVFAALERKARMEAATTTHASPVVQRLDAEDDSNSSPTMMTAQAAGHDDVAGGTRSENNRRGRRTTGRLLPDTVIHRSRLSI
jgi:hypothetical protein